MKKFSSDYSNKLFVKFSMPKRHILSKCIKNMICGYHNVKTVITIIFLINKLLNFLVDSESRPTFLKRLYR